MSKSQYQHMGTADQRCLVKMSSVPLKKKKKKSQASGWPSVSEVIFYLPCPDLDSRQALTMQLTAPQCVNSLHFLVT